MDLGLSGKVALVSGGSKGIGRAISEELGREGCRVVVTARGGEAVDSTVAAIRSALRHKFLSPKTHATTSAIAGLRKDFDSIDKHSLEDVKSLQR